VKTAAQALGPMSGEQVGALRLLLRAHPHRGLALKRL
jgi:hypothetical protein